MRTVVCLTEGCPRRRVTRRVRDVVVAPGVVTRPTLYCADCGTEMTITGDEPETSPTPAEDASESPPEPTQPEANTERRPKRPPERRSKR